MSDEEDKNKRDFSGGKDLADPATFTSPDTPDEVKIKTLEELLSDWEKSPQKWGNPEAWADRKPGGGGSTDSAVAALGNLVPSAGDYEPNRLGRFMPAVSNPEAEQMQRFRGRTGSGSGGYLNSPAFLGTDEEAQPPGRFDGLLELYDQLHSSDSTAAKEYLDTIQGWLGTEGQTRQGQIEQDTNTINRQLDDVFAATEDRDKNNDLRFEAEFQTAIDGMEDTQEAADARLGVWGIDPQRWIAGAGAETAALLTSQAQSGARFANEMGAIMKMAHGMATARVNQGMAAESRNLANTVSSLGLQAQLNYKNNIQQVNRELMMNKIGVEQASLALDAAIDQAEADSAGALMAYQIMAKATNTSSQLWYGADKLNLTDDLFARTPMIPEIPDASRPAGAIQISPEGLSEHNAFYKSPAELQQALETYLQFDSRA